MSAAVRRLEEILPAAGGGSRPIICAAAALNADTQQDFLAWTLRSGAAWVLEPDVEALVATVLWSRPTLIVAGDRELAILGFALGERKPRLVRIDEFEVEVVPEGVLLVTRHEDRPGVIGALGTILGEEGINISRMQVGLVPENGDSIAVLGISGPLPAATLDRVRELDAIRELHHVQA